MNKIKKIFITLFTIQFLFFPILAYAQNGANGAGTQTSVNQVPIKIDNPVKGASDILQLLQLILSKIVMPIATIIVVMWIIFSGFKFVTAQGNAKKIEEAKSSLLWALIGAGILLGASAISGVVVQTVKDLMA